MTRPFSLSGDGPVHLRVLLASDTPLESRLFTESLKALPFIESLVVVNTTKQALSQFLASPPHVVIVSIGLPGGGGFELLRCIKQADSCARVVLVSRVASAFVEYTAELLGATAHYCENDDFARLAEILRRI
jgi:DNA-binding NarL/FixJ family response regulator